METSATTFAVYPPVPGAVAGSGRAPSIARMARLWTWPRGATPVHTDKLHLTLHFLGNQPVGSLPALLDGLAVPLSPFRLQLGRGGAVA
jgi:2'-5' RNA ligase